MKDSIVKWVVAFALLTVIAVAAIFAVEDDEVTSREVEEKFQTLENKTLSVDEKHALLDQDGDLSKSSIKSCANVLTSPNFLIHKMNLTHVFYHQEIQ